jgi:hypothetical protein
MKGAVRRFIDFADLREFNSTRATFLQVYEYLKSLSPRSGSVICLDARYVSLYLYRHNSPTSADVMFLSRLSSAFLMSAKGGGSKIDDCTAALADQPSRRGRRAPNWMPELYPKTIAQTYDGVEAPALPGRRLRHAWSARSPAFPGITAMARCVLASSHGFSPDCSGLHS